MKKHAENLIDKLTAFPTGNYHKKKTYIQLLIAAIEIGGNALKRAVEKVEAWLIRETKG